MLSILSVPCTNHGAAYLSFRPCFDNAMFACAQYRQYMAFPSPIIALDFDISRCLFRISCWPSLPPQPRNDNAPTFSRGRIFASHALFVLALDRRAHALGPYHDSEQRCKSVAASSLLASSRVAIGILAGNLCLVRRGKMEQRACGRSQLSRAEPFTETAAVNSSTRTDPAFSCCGCCLKLQ